jgi:putative cell wall-binding protein
VSGGGTYQANASVTVTATAGTGYHFVNWKENGNSVSTDASYAFTATANRTLMAVFEQDTSPATTYTIAVSANNASYGTVSGGGTYQANASVTATATAGTGYHFANWTESGSSVSTDVSYTFTATANRTLVAVFEQDASPIPAITIPTSSDKGSVDVSATITGTTAAISVTDSQIEKIVSNQDTTGTVKVDLTSQKTVDTAVIPAKLVDAASSATGSPGLEITMTDGSLTLDKTALSSIGKKDITVRVNTVKPSSLTDTQKTALGDKANDAVIVNVDVLVDAVKTSTFNGGILTISIPYALKADENPDDLTVWYIADDGKVMPMHGKYNAETKSVEFTTTHLSYYAVVNVSVKRLSGDDRYGTMAEIVKQAFPNGCDTAILASGINWPDALAASALAGAKGCPVLLTDSSQLTGETSELLTSLNVKNVIIIGGTAAVSDTVKKAIEAKNIKTERIWGNDRTQTADKIARRVIDESSADTIIICSGQNFPDALSISSYAYAQKMPILLTGSDGKLTTDSLAIADSFSKAIIVGGEDAVSLDVEQQLKTVQPVRYAGKNRHGTSIEIINKLFGGSESILAVATGEDYPDALVGAVLAGKNGGAILLVDGQGTSLTSSQKTIVGNARSVRILGGTAAVSAALETSIDNILK